MRTSFVRLATLVGSVALVVSCDAGPTVVKFGNGIAGGTTGTAPVTPPPPPASGEQLGLFQDMRPSVQALFTGGSGS